MLPMVSSFAVHVMVAVAGVAADPPDLPAVSATWADAPASGWVSPRDPLRIALNRNLAPGEGRLAVVIGNADWTGICDVSPGGVTCRPGAVSLPSGVRDLSVQLVDPAGGWRELARWPLRVRSAGGFERLEAAPALEFLTKGQHVQRRTPAAAPTPRDTFQDIGGRGSFTSTLVKSGWTTRLSAAVVAAGYLNERLRHSTLQADAPVADLASYLVSVESSRASFTLGHVQFSPHRHLVADFGARGAAAKIRLTPVLDVEVGATSATSLVGWSVPFGFTDASHQALNLTVGIEALPRRPGGLRVAASIADGERGPRPGVTQGLVTDAQRSRGAGLRVVASDATRRFTLDAGLARTRFEAPDDPGLSQGLALTPIATTTRAARYVDASVGLVHQARLGATQTANVTLAVHHEQVDPLYRSLSASSVLADQRRDGANVTVALGPSSSRVAYERSHDNLAGVTSMLTTRTRKLDATTMVPLGSVGRTESTPWLPALSYQIVRVHQRGDALPVDGGFDSLSQVPDQLSTLHTLGAEWLGAHWRGGYRFNRSLQDNRQIGRAAADFLTAAHVLAFGAMPSPRVNLGVELGFDAAEAFENNQRDLTRRAAFSAMLQPTRLTNLTALVSRTRVFDPAGARASTNTDLSVQLSQTLPFNSRRPERSRAQAFVRFARQTLSAFDLAVAQSTGSQAWTLNTGVTLHLQ